MKIALKVLTANRLSDGIAVWFAPELGWIEQIADAFAASTPDMIAELEAAAKNALAEGQHCDVVLIDVEVTENGLRPIKLRERIRADGPTIRLDLGKQADKLAQAA